MHDALNDTCTTHEFISKSLAHYPELLGRFLSQKFKAAIRPPGDTNCNVHASIHHKNATLPATMPSVEEKLQFRERLRGDAPEDLKAAAEERSIGGLRDTRKSVSKLAIAAEFGKALGLELMHKLRVPYDK